MTDHKPASTVRDYINEFNRYLAEAANNTDNLLLLTNLDNERKHIEQNEISNNNA